MIAIPYGAIPYGTKQSKRRRMGRSKRNHIAKSLLVERNPIALMVESLSSLNVPLLFMLTVT